MQQLPLKIKLNDHLTFDNFFVGKHHEVMYALNGNDNLFLWGDEGVGKTHLLQAFCHQCDGALIYLPLRERETLSHEMLEGVEHQQCIVVDDIECVMRHMAWEKALFHAYNEAIDKGVRFIVSSNAPPRQLNARLPDLVSRLAQMVVFKVDDLDDDGKIKALQLHAKNRGIVLSDQAANFLLVHHSRNMHNLIMLLDTIDQMSLAAQRKITVPFLKEVVSVE